jgi:hypothetical protein
MTRATARSLLRSIAILGGAACLLAPTLGCDNTTEAGCHYVESEAIADSVQFVNTAHAGGTLRIRVTGLSGAGCKHFVRTDVAVQGVTIDLMPIEGGTLCPETQCPSSLHWYADTVSVAVRHAGWVLVRVHQGSRSLIDSTMVLP